MAEAVPCTMALFMLPFLGPRIDRSTRIFGLFFLIRAIPAQMQRVVEHAP